MDLFQKLGGDIEREWLASNYNEDHLPAMAKAALAAADLPSKVSAWEILEWSLGQIELPPQRDLPGKFGDPPITLYAGPRFHIDVYFWFEGTTAIHQHGFCGAFQVLSGSSIHSWYEFETRQVINSFSELGEMSLKVCELLEVGDIQEIWPGRQYIHALFHLDQPSATIVVRTDKSPLYLPQFAYHKPGFAIDPFFEHPTTTKKLQMLGALYRGRRTEADSLATRYLESSDLQTSFAILTQLRHWLRSDQLSQLFKLESPTSRFAAFLDVVEKRHGAGGKVLRDVFERADVIDEIIRRRSYVTDPEHRFFMALLLNVDGRERIFELIRRRFPETEPVEKVLDWVFDLSQTRVVGIDASNALGIPDFGNAEMLVLENLLNGKTDDEARDALAAENADLDTGAVLAKVRNAAIFRPLLSV
jgi:hypothetical protein